MSDVKQVKVDNWGIYFLQRLKHFFNRTDYCDLTLQFQDNAQLKVHRLVLNACTEYFELLERTCEMYEDCLVMPDDLQADVVVPIVNFMYTGHLEFRLDLLERLYQTSQILNMPVLSKLLESHRLVPPKAPTHSYSKRYTKPSEPKAIKTSTPAASSHKRSYSKAFDNNIVYKDKKTYQPVSKPDKVNNSSYRPPSPISVEPFAARKLALNDPRPTRYELPEELDTDNVFDNSFCNISYTSQPLMVHPETIKRYKAKRSHVFGESSSSKKLSAMSTVDIVECKKISSKEDSLFDDSNPDHSFNNESDLFNATYVENEKDPNQLFDQILDTNDGAGGPKVTIETKDSKAASNLDHARIISEVLKKYPHLVKSNKNIKLKILDPVPGKGKKQLRGSTAPAYAEDKPFKLKKEEEDFTYETDVIDSKQAAKLIAMGAENTKGPWICLICGTPGKALHFNSYYKFRRHLVDVHNEKPVSNICEYCGLRSLKRNYLLYHLYAHHGVQPPPQYHFPKCNLCSYIALTEGLLVKHKLSHKDIKNFRCNVCSAAFASSSQLLIHIQNTGHKYSAEKKANLQCIYCLKVFLRETNLYAHIKTHHKNEAKTDGIIEDSDEEKHEEERPRSKPVKFEPSTSFDNDYEEVELQFPIQQRIVEKPVAARKQLNIMSNQKQKILNPGFGSPKPAQKAKHSNSISPAVHNDFFQDIKNSIGPVSNNNQEEEIVVIDNNEYIMKDNQLIPKTRKTCNTDYIISDMVDTASLETLEQPTTSVEYTNIQNTDIAENVQQQSSMIIKKSANLNQPIQIVVSNEEEYKALMASNHPIIFDSGETNKTLTVLTAPHHNQDIETRTIDLDTTQSNEMVILPHEYPLNVSEAVTTENSNIVVVYSHPVDDENKQFQILTTGGIGAQFVQSSAILTQNYETVTTSTATINAHCIETQEEQNWQNNIQSLDGQQIQLPPHSVIEDVVDSDQVVIKPIVTETSNNLDELPEVHLGSQIEKELPPSETDITLDQSNITIENVNQTVEHDIVEEQSNVTQLDLIEKDTSNITDNEAMETIPLTKSMPDISTNDENVEEHMEIANVLEQPMDTENVMEQAMETDNVIEQQIETETVVENPEESENFIEQPMITDNVQEQPIGAENEEEQPLNARNEIEQPILTDNMAEQPVETENMIIHTMETENVIQKHIETENAVKQSVELQSIIEKPVELENFAEEPVKMPHEVEQPLETECVIEPTSSIQNELSSDQEHPAETISDYSVVEKSQNPSPAEDQQAGLIASQAYDDIVEINQDINVAPKQTELVESQAYDDIVEINHDNNVEPILAKEAEGKIQSLTSEWSEDEYDVAEDQGSRIAEIASNSLPPSQPIEDIPELEESIENIQQEVQKQIQMPQIQIEPDCDTEESAISSQEEDSSSQEMQLPPITESPVLDNPQAQQKISSLLNDWEDNDSQEETNTVSENTEPEKAEEPTGNICLPENSAEVPKNDNIKSLVSDWDDEEEEIKE